MTARELKEKLTVDDIKTLLELMEAEIYYEDDSAIITNTICHHGSKPKLYFYKDSMSFHCYTECGQMDVITLVQKYLDLEENEIYKAIKWICNKLNIESNVGFGNNKSNVNTLSDWEFINRYKKQNKKENIIELKTYDENIMKIFQDIYVSEWIDDGISEETMKKYNIKYSTCQQKIIIPHYDINNNLIGVRTRAMLDEDIAFAKYAPLRIGDKWYNHQLGYNLFGLNQNIETIKRKRKLMIVEAEKSVLQSDTMFGDDNFTVALCGSNMSNFQKDMILSLGLREVIVALDRQYEKLGNEEHNKWVEHIKKNIILPLVPYVNINIIWDTNNLLDYKDSPTDKGKDILLKLMENKIPVGTF